MLRLYITSGKLVGEHTTMHYAGQHLSVRVYMCILRGTGEKNQGYALLMTANAPETVLYRVSTFEMKVKAC